MNPTSDIRATAERVIHRILSDSGRETRLIEDADELVDSLQLDSLDLAVMVVGLHQELGIDPFRAGAAPVRTFGELVAVYERYAGGPQ